MGGEWRRVTLGDLVEVIHGYAFKSENFSDEPTSDILLTPGNFAVGGGFKYDKLKYYDGEVPEGYILREGDLLVTMTDLSKQADTLGYPAIVPDDSGVRYLHNQRLGKVVVKDASVSEKGFLYYLMCGKDYRHEIVASATGTTVKHTAPKRIRKFEFDLPPLQEQRGIANVLGSLDGKIELNRQMNRTLEKMAQALFKSWFVDFDPVVYNAVQAGQSIPERFQVAAARYRDNPGLMKLPRHVLDLFPDRFEDSELGLIPLGWSASIIGDAVTCVGGGTPSTKNPEFWDGGTHPFLTPKDMSSLKSPVIFDTERHLTRAGVEKISSKKISAGAVMMSSRAPIGYLGINRISVSVNQGVIAMICEGVLSNYYVLLWAKNNMGLIKGKAGGTTFAEISKKNFRTTPVVVPSERILTEFSGKVSTLFEKISANVVSSHTLSGIRDALLPKLISGELPVPGAERVLEGL